MLSFVQQTSEVERVITNRGVIPAPSLDFT